MTVDEIREKYLKEEGIAQGMEKGIAQGIEKGALEAKIESARNLLKLLDDETISQTIGLDIEIVKKLRMESIN
ncbi:MAG: hypothetical protein ACRCX2_16970 [Paraclostridium sp.]